MKKLFMILAAGVLAIAATTGCDIDASLEGSKNKIVVDNIFVDPDGWRPYMIDGRFSHLYADIEMPEITEYIYNRGTFRTYVEFEDRGTGGQGVLVQEAEGMTKTKGMYVDGIWREYTETIRCGYSAGNLRIEISRYPSFDRPPEETMYFRTVIMW